jgi:hypothetical protein
MKIMVMLSLLIQHTRPIYMISHWACLSELTAIYNVLCLTLCCWEMRSCKHLNGFQCIQNMYGCDGPRVMLTGMWYVNLLC